MNGDDRRHMARALVLARRGLYTTHPNPRVGCVLVRDGQVVGEGYHQRTGEPHAERIALAVAGERARGATAYVTLEPCSHHGRTPPCSDSLIKAGVERVVAAMQDPNPRVAGNGLRALRDAGVNVACGLLEEQAQRLNPGFIRRMESGRPYVRCKLAMSLDGRTAMAGGESKWITAEAARADVQRLRARSDAIVTGIGTLLADDPSLNVRLAAGQLAGMRPGDPVRQPLRVVLDPRLDTPAGARMLDLPGETLLVHGDAPEARAATLGERGATLLALPEVRGEIELGALLDHLGSLEINEVLIEAGATLAGGALQAGLVDELVIYAAPHIMGSAALGLFHLPGLERMADRVDLVIGDLRRVGSDIRITATPVPRPR